MPISCPASATAFISAGNVSIEWPGINQVVLTPSRANGFSGGGLPTSPAKRPREMSSGESSPPYEPSQPATASTSTPKAQRISLGIVTSGNVDEIGQGASLVQRPGNRVLILAREKQV